MREFLDELSRRLDDLRAGGLHRGLLKPEGIDFSSNDYLGLSRHPRVRERMLEALRSGPVSSPASRLLRGNLAQHEDLEERLARFKGTERALLFPSGYQANLAVLSTLIGREDRVLSDELNHASIIDGLRLSGCRKVIFPHRDARSVERHLSPAARPSGGRTFLVTESLFSMEGDAAPLGEYAAIAERHGVILIVDDAHATGLFGPGRASGLCEEAGVERRAAAIVSTFGKALGLAGACVAGPAPVIECLINEARPFIFSTAPPPALLAGVEAALEVIAAEPERRKRAFALADRLRGLLRAGGLDCGASVGPIVPVVLGENDRALRLGKAMRRRGYDVRAIRPPSVPPGTARIRLSVHADHTVAEIDGLARAILEALAREAEASPTGAGPAAAR